jgi:Holliday junction resolvase RusA-like endonuclease
MKSITYTFVKPIPSKKNSKQIFKNKSGKMFISSSSNYKDWQRIELMLIKSKIKERNISKCSIDYCFYSPNKRTFDISNKLESVNDLLVDAGILIDDNYNVLSSMIVSYNGIDKDKYCEIKINYD